MRACDTDAELEMLVACMFAVKQWYLHNNLLLNADELEVIKFGTVNQLISVDVRLARKALQNVLLPCSRRQTMVGSSTLTPDGRSRVHTVDDSRHFSVIESRKVVHVERRSRMRSTDRTRTMIQPHGTLMLMYKLQLHK